MVYYPTHIISILMVKSHFFGPMRSHGLRFCPSLGPPPVAPKSLRLRLRRAEPGAARSPGRPGGCRGVAGGRPASGRESGVGPEK